MVLSGYSRFFHHYNWWQWYSWKINQSIRLIIFDDSNENVAVHIILVIAKKSYAGQMSINFPYLTLYIQSFFTSTYANLTIKLWRPTFTCIRGPYWSRRYYNIRCSRLCLSMYGLSIDQYWVVCSRPNVRNNFHVKTMLCSSLLHILLFRVSVLLMLFVYTLYLRMLVSTTISMPDYVRTV